MNHIYKTVWNATLGTWTAVQETAKSHGKSSGGKAARAASQSVGVRFAFTLVASALLLASGQVMAVTGTGSSSGDSSYCFYDATSQTVICGDGSTESVDTVDGKPAKSVVLGKGAKNTGESNVAVGLSASTAGTSSVAVGDRAKAAANQAIAVGQNANANGAWDISIGREAAWSAAPPASGQGRNIAIGDGALRHGLAVNNNMVLGTSAGEGLEGSRNIILGTYATSDEAINTALAKGNTQAEIGFLTREVTNEDGTKKTIKYIKADNTVSVGHRALAAKTAAVAVGQEAKALGNLSAAFGNGSKASGANAVAAGSYATATGTNSVAIGGSQNNADASKTLANAHFAIAIGSVAQATASGAVAMGQNAVAAGKETLSLGAGSGSRGVDAANATNQIVPRTNAGKTSSNGLVHMTNIGYKAGADNINNNYGINIGYEAGAGGYNSYYGEGVAIGNKAGGVNKESTTVTAAMQAASQAKGAAAGVIITGNTNTAISSRAGVNALGHDNVAIGKDAGGYSSGNNNVAIGRNAGRDQAKNPAGAYIDQAVAETFSKAGNTVAVGEWAHASADHATAIGTRAKAGLESSVALGKDAKTTGTASEEGAIAIGRTSHADGQGSTAMGINARSAKQSIAIGTNANNTFGVAQNIGSSSVAIGNNTNAAGTNAVALGNQAAAKGDKATALGFDTKAEGQSSVVIGDSAQNQRDTGVTSHPHADQAVAVGVSSNVNSLGGVAIGSTTKTTGVYGTAVGIGSVNNTNFGVALGALSTTDQTIQVDRAGYAPVASAQTAVDTTKANAAGVSVGGKVLSTQGSGPGQTAVRPDGVSDGDTIRRQIHNVAAGTDDTDAVNVAQLKAVADVAKAAGTHYYSVKDQTGDAAQSGSNYNNDGATGDRSLAAGIHSKATGNNATAVGGKHAKATAVQSLALGSDTLASGTSSIAIGGDDLDHLKPDIRTYYHTLTGDTINVGTYTDTTASADASIALGVQTQATGDLSMALGTKSDATGVAAVAVGTGAKSKDEAAVALGAGAVAQERGKFSVAVGTKAETSAQGAVAVGTAANASKEKAVALGAGSTTATDATKETTATVGSITYGAAAGAPGAFAGAANVVPGHQVSVGKAGLERQIKHVAPGRIAADSTDAINGSQLHATQTAIGNLASSTARNFGGGAAVQADGSISAPTYTINGNAYNDVGAALQAAAASGGGTHYYSVNSNEQGADSNYNNDGATGVNALAAGRKAQAAGANSVAVGNEASAGHNLSVAIGHAAQTRGKHSLAIGARAKAGTKTSPSAAVDAGSWGTAIGYNAEAEGDGSPLAIGTESKTVGGQSPIAIGDWATAEGTGAIAIGGKIGGKHLPGQSTYAKGVQTTALGYLAQATEQGALAVGANANASLANAVALGAGSLTSTNATQETHATVGGITYGAAPAAGPAPAPVGNSFAGAANVQAGDQVSVGSAGSERQIKHVAPGAISATSTDAINGSQLHATQAVIGNVAGSVKNILGGDAAVGGDGKLSMNDIGGTGKGTIHEAIAAATTKVTSNNSSIGVTHDATTNTYDLSVNAQGLAESAQLPVVYTQADGAKVYKHSNGSFYDKPEGDNTAQVVDAGNVIASMQNANGSTTAPTTLTNVAAGKRGTDAVNVNQLRESAPFAYVNEAGHILTRSVDPGTGDVVFTKADGTPYAGTDISISALNPTDAAQVSTRTTVGNVAAGKKDSDAVNVSQLKGAAAALGGGAGIADGTDPNVPAGTFIAPSYTLTNGNPSTGGTTAYTNVGAALGGLNDAVNRSLTFAGDSGANVERKLGSTLNVKGGATGTLTDGNIGVVADANNSTLNIKLAKDVNLGADGSLKAGNTTVNKDGITIAMPPTPAGAIPKVSLTAQGLDNGGNKITNVANGTDDGDAVNFGQLKALSNAAKTHFYSVNSNDTAAGNYNNDGATGRDALAAGVGALAKQNSSIAIGKDAKTDGNPTAASQSVAIGHQATVAGDLGLAIGPKATVTGDAGAPGGIAIGAAATSKNGGMAIGSGADTGNGTQLIPGVPVRLNNNVALGDSARVKDDTNFRVALGSMSIAEADLTTDAYKPTAGATIAGIAAPGVTLGEVSVGGDNTNFPGGILYRRITNVAAGSADTDAVNVSQLKAVAARTETTPLTVTDGKVTAPAANSADAGKLATAGDIANAINSSGFKLSAQGNNATASFVNPGETVDLKNTDGNIVISKTAGSNDVNFDLKEVVTIGTGSSRITIDGRGNKGNIFGLSRNLPKTQSSNTAAPGQPSNITTAQALPGNADALSTNAATVGDVLSVGWNLQTNSAATDFVRTYDTVNFANGQGTTVSSTSDGATTTIKVDVNAQGLAESAQLPVVYTKADGAKVYKHSDGKFYDKPEGDNTAQVVDAGNVIASMQNADGRTTVVPVKLANVKAGVNNTDAVNVSQLKDAAAALGGGARIADGTDPNVPAGTFIAPSYTITKTDGTNYDAANNVGTALGNLNAEVVKPIAFAGDSGANVERKLGSTLNVKGGAAGTLTDGNIGVVADANNSTLNIKLAQNINLGADGSVQTGNTTVNNDGITIAMPPTPAGAIPKVSLTAQGLDNGGNKITNVADGTDDGDAVNLGQLKALSNAAQTHYYSVNDAGVQGGNYNNDGATGGNALAAGVGAQATHISSTAVGHDAKATNEAAVAIGWEAEARGNHSIALGGSSQGQQGHVKTQAQGDSSMAIGFGAQTGAGANWSIAQGDLAKVGEKAERSVAIGVHAAVADNASDAVALGNGAKAGDNFTVAVGFNAEASASGAMAQGNGAKAEGEDSVAHGKDSQASGKFATAVGNSSRAGLGAAAVGNGANASGNYATAFGTGSEASQGGAAALGNDAKAQAWAAVAVGRDAQATQTGAVAIGESARAAHEHSVALGSGSATAAVDNTGRASATVGGITYSGFAADAPTSMVSVGRDETTIPATDPNAAPTVLPAVKRTITHVAAGRIAADSTDAINGSQLHATQTVIGNVAGSVKNILGGDAAVDADGKLSMSNIGGTGKGTIHEAIAAINTTAGAGWGIGNGGTDPVGTVKPNARVDFVAGNGSTKVDVAHDTTNGNSKVTVSAAPSALQYTGTNNAAGNNTPNADQFTPTNQVTLVGAAGNANGVTINNVAPGAISADSKQAINGSQLHAVGSSTAAALGGTSAFDAATGKVTAGLSVGGTTHTSVQAALDAINTTAGAGWNLQANSGTASNVAPNGTVNVVDGSNTKVTLAGTTLKVDVVDDPVFSGQVTANGGLAVANNLTVARGTNVNMGDNVIHNVADGVADTDAVNVRQMRAMSGNITNITNQIKQVDARVTNVDNRVTHLSGRVDGIDARVTNVDNRVTEVDNRVSNVDNRVTGVDNRVTDLTGRVDGIDTRVTDVSNLVGPNLTNPDGTRGLTVYDVAKQTRTEHQTVIEALNQIKREGTKYSHTQDNGEAPIIGPSNSSSAGALASTAAGVNAIVEKGAESGLAAGHRARVLERAKRGVAIGHEAVAGGESSLAAGDRAKAYGHKSISFGTGNEVYADRSGAIGDPTTIIASATDSYSIGNNNTVNTADTFVMGNNVVTSVANSVYLGAGAAATAAPTAQSAGMATYNASVVDGVTHHYAGGTPAGVVSVGDVGQERRVQNVAAGLVSPTSTDAINGSQLYQTNAAIGGLNNRINVNHDKAMGGIASAMASAGLPQAYLPGKSMIAMGVGAYQGRSAVAVGVSTISDNGRWIIKGSVNANNKGNVGATLGAGYQW